MKQDDHQARQSLEHPANENVTALARATDWEAVHNDSVQNLRRPGQVDVALVSGCLGWTELVNVEEHVQDSHVHHSFHSGVEVGQTQVEQERVVVLCPQAGQIAAIVWPDSWYLGGVFLTVTREGNVLLFPCGGIIGCIELALLWVCLGSLSQSGLPDH